MEKLFDRCQKYNFSYQLQIKKALCFFISQRPLVHKTLVSFSLPFIIKAKAQQLIYLQIAVKVLILSNTIIITHIQGYIG